MRKDTGYIVMLIGLLMVMFLLPSCYDVRKDREICDYNIQLRYDYNEENGTADNMIEYYIETVDEFIFDESGVLFQHTTFTHDRCVEYLYSEFTLPAGRYSVVVVGNMDGRSKCPAVPGLTHRDDMLLTLNGSQRMENTCSVLSERLYYGYRSFTVKPKGISRVRVDMVNSHLSLKFRITWKDGATPERDDYYALLKSVPSEYSLMPEFIYPSGSVDCQDYVPELFDDYKSLCNNIVHLIPQVHPDRNILTHRTNVRVNVDNEMWGEFVTYRIRQNTAPKLQIFRASDNQQIIRDIDLRLYFDWYDYLLDTELKQEYEIDIVVDGDKIIMMPLNISDWDEGGGIYG